LFGENEALAHFDSERITPFILFSWLAWIGKAVVVSQKHCLNIATFYGKHGRLQL